MLVQIIIFCVHRDELHLNSFQYLDFAHLFFNFFLILLFLYSNENDFDKSHLTESVATDTKNYKIQPKN